MIQIENITKGFDSMDVLKDFTLDIKPGCIYGVVGYNGVGKTTLLKILCGIYRPEKGRIMVDDMPVYENEAVKKKFFMVQDEPLFLPQASLKGMEKFYQGYYPAWSHKTFILLSEIFGLDIHKRINGFSKGMQRQASVILALSARPEYLLLDESFDGLDLAKRNLLQKLLFTYLKTTAKNIIISSHNLRELEGLCDYVAMIKDCGLNFGSSIEKMHRDRTKFRARFRNDIEEELLKKAGGYYIAGNGKSYTFLSDNSFEQIQAALQPVGLTTLSTVAMTLEEIFLEQSKEDQDYDFTEVFR